MITPLAHTVAICNSVVSIFCPFSGHCGTLAVVPRQMGLIFFPLSEVRQNLQNARFVFSTGASEIVHVRDCRAGRGSAAQSHARMYTAVQFAPPLTAIF